MGSVSSLNSLLSSATSSSSSGLDLSTLLQAATGASTAGIDVTSAVNAAIYAAEAPERQWQTEQSAISSQVSALNGIKSSLSTLGSDLTDLNSLSGSLASRAVSSSSTAVSATAAAGATTGNHSISVQSLATTGSWYSPAVSAGTALAGSTLTITSASGTQYTFPTGSGSGSLSALAQSINDSSAGVSASVIADASGSRLALVSSTSGAAADFTVSYGVSNASAWSSASLPSAGSALTPGSFQIGDGTSTSTITVSAGDTLTTVSQAINAQNLGVTASVVTDSAGAHLQLTAQPGASITLSSDPAFSFTRASTGANAALTVDGVPVSSASNTVTGAIPGVTLSLGAVTQQGSPALLKVAADTSTIQQALSQFVSDYNSALGTVTAQFSFSTSSGSQGALSGDSSVRSLQNTLLGLASYSAAGSASGGINTLADLGITMNDDGTLALNSSQLNNALQNPAAVQNFFQGASLNGFAQQFQTQLSTYTDPGSGSLAQEINNLTQQYTALSGQVTDYENGYIASQRTVLTAMYSQAEIALQQLPKEMNQIQAELGNKSSGS